jgi:hypothetical protein
MNVFWDVAPCSVVEIDRRFRGAYCLHYQGSCPDDYPIQSSNISVGWSIYMKFGIFLLYVENISSYM